MCVVDRNNGKNGVCYVSARSKHCCRCVELVFLSEGTGSMPANDKIKIHPIHVSLVTPQEVYCEDLISHPPPRFPSPTSSFGPPFFFSRISSFKTLFPLLTPSAARCILVVFLLCNTDTQTPLVSQPAPVHIRRCSEEDYCPPRPLDAHGYV